MRNNRDAKHIGLRLTYFGYPRAAASHHGAMSTFPLRPIDSASATAA
jgi:hypothetical protein